MDHNSIIDRKTYEVCTHEEDHPDVFICDKKIAPVVALLNKKGYNTVASCSGHYRLEFYEWFDEDISNLEEYKKDKRIIIKDIRENSFDYWSEVDKTAIYILFDKIYDFESLPEKFEYCTDEKNRCSIEYRINFYDKDDKKKRRYVIEKEIDNLCNILKDWVDKLPVYERND